MFDIKMIFIFVSLTVCQAQVVTNLVLNAPYAETFQTSCSKYSYFRVAMTDPCLDLNITVHPTAGEPDIYVSREINGVYSYPSMTSLSWAAFADGVYSLLISHWDPNSSPGFYDIAVYGDCSKISSAASYQIKAAAVMDPTDKSDIYLYPKVSRYQHIHVPDYKTQAQYAPSISDYNAYKYYHFCLPVCADVVVTIENCIDNTECPGNYSYPELMVSRTTRKPREKDYSWRLMSLRSISIDHTDPSARDNNGYIPGSYYVSVFGWCTPDNNVVSWDYDGPCLYAANINYNVTVKITPQPAASCAAAPTYPTVPQNTYQLLTSGVPARGYVKCSDYYYFAINVPNPCNNLNIAVTTALGSTRNSTAELAISQWPNVLPVLEGPTGGLVWSSFDWGVNNYTISAFDPAFNGGYSCGLNGRSPCQVIIGVYGYCASATQHNVDFTITATLDPVHKIFEVPVENQAISANGVRQYAFCVPTFESSRALLNSWDSSCDCPSAYANLDMVVSKSNPNATIDNYSWRIGHYSPINYIDLLTTDRNTRPGTYYLNVYGWCTPDSQCSDKCNCSPCSNVAKTMYSLLVAPLTAFTASDGNVPLATCPASTAFCSCGTVSSDSQLSKGAIAGIVIACIVVILVIVGIIYCVFCRGSAKGGNFSELDESSSMIQPQTADDDRAPGGQQAAPRGVGKAESSDEQEIELRVATLQVDAGV